MSVLYRTITRPGHPLADERGSNYEHRFVLYDTLGPGPHQCHWCGMTVDWVAKCHANALFTDHLNSDTRDNRPSNLVPSCRRCNTTRMPGGGGRQREGTPINVRLPDDMIGKIDHRRATTGQTRAEAIRKMLAWALTQPKDWTP